MKLNRKDSFNQHIVDINGKPEEVNDIVVENDLQCSLDVEGEDEAGDVASHHSTKPDCEPHSAERIDLALHERQSDGRQKTTMCYRIFSIPRNCWSNFVNAKQSNSKTPSIFCKSVKSVTVETKRNSPD